MPPVAPQPVQLTCPACGTPFRAAIYTLVDVTAQSELKAALLSGQLNVAVCPNCRTASMLGAPLIYHDAAKQLCLVYFPQELNSRPEDQERFVGEATSFIIRSLPANAPRGYLLAPRRFLTLPSLLDAILEADGVSREMLERQRAHVDLISELAARLNDEEQFAALVEQRRADLTPEFFATLAAFIEATPPAQADSRELLLQLQARLADLAAADHDSPDDEELAAAIARLQSASDDELELAVAELRPLIDYGFFQAWTEQIDAAEAAGQHDEADRLTARRARILSIVEELDREAQQMFEAGSATLGEVLQAPDPLAALRERADAVDEAFMMVLSANAGAAQRAGRDDMVALLERLAEEAVAIIQARLSPEERFINELLLAETPRDATALLRKNVGKITPDLVKRLNELAEQEEKRANKPTAERLRQLARESGAMLF
ncbi:MAG: CpXC domain-containing protein [Chloroflexi bacterium OHK40]